MKFGKVNNPESVDLTLPEDHPQTSSLLSGDSSKGSPVLYTGCAKWGRKELQNFYPRGTKDELTYYGTRFNAIELNATFYRNFPADQISAWTEKVPDYFRFFPKVNQEISHWKWLKEAESATEAYLSSVYNFKEKLGTIFLQLRGNFSPTRFEDLETYLDIWPKHLPLALELRHADWFNEPETADRLFRLLEEKNIANVLVDTAGRRDLIHMRLTNNEAFVRFVGANHKSDYSRLNDWVVRMTDWVDAGLKKIHFFIHQNTEQESPLLTDYFVKEMKKAFGNSLQIPGFNGSQGTSGLDENGQPTLF